MINVYNSFDKKIIPVDPRSWFAIYCLGEGWYPAFGDVEVFCSYEEALFVMNELKKENLNSQYEVREVPPYSRALEQD